MNMQIVWLAPLVLIIGYLIGSISFATIFSFYFHGEDIRTKGSGNAGATNINRIYGKKIALLTLIFDILKPITAAIIAYLLKNYVNTKITVSWVLLPVIIGHIYPLFFGFRGGKGAACFGGALIVINWYVALVTLVILFTIIKTFKMVSIGSIFTSFLSIPLQISFVFIPYFYTNLSSPLIFNDPWWIASTILTIAFLFLTWSHKSNISRILRGTESKISY